jgi:hypothetical protein
MQCEGGAGEAKERLVLPGHLPEGNGEELGNVYCA